MMVDLWKILCRCQKRLRTTGLEGGREGGREDEEHTSGHCVGAWEGRNTTLATVLLTHTVSSKELLVEIFDSNIH